MPTVVAKVGDQVFLFQGKTEKDICQGFSACLGKLNSDPVKLGMMRLAEDSKYYVSTLTETYAAYTDAIGADGAGKVGDAANIVTVFCPKCAPITAPISMVASAVKIYFEPTMSNVVAPLAGHFGGKLLYRSGKLTQNQEKVGAAGIDLGVGGLLNELDVDSN